MMTKPRVMGDTAVFAKVSPGAEMIIFKDSEQISIGVCD
jgi:hypothetical protein